jgi:protein-disulfide isomerase
MMKWIVSLSVVVCVVLIGVGIYLGMAPTKVGPRQVPLATAYEQHLQDGYWERGASNPTVIVTEYGDLQCPACDAFEPIIAGAIQQTSGFAQLEFKHYPLEDKHDKALLAAEAAEAAGRQGKFWQFHDLMYQTQATWENDAVYTFRDELDTYAQQLGLNVSQFDTDLNDNTASLDQIINANIKQGDAVGLTGTPYVLINGKVLTNLPDSAGAMAQLITAAQPSK